VLITMDVLQLQSGESLQSLTPFVNLQHVSQELNFGSVPLQLLSQLTKLTSVGRLYLVSDKN
jgi:hypothetical protein